ncbi:hypothetical protein JCM3774_003786 [Rhodotorula dairenensis]
MSLAEYGFPQPRLRTVSAQLRGSLDDLHAAAAAAGHGSPGLEAHAWTDWNAQGISPDRANGAQQPYSDAYADLIADGAGFDPATGSFAHHRTESYPYGQGYEAHMSLMSIDDSPPRAGIPANAEAHQHQLYQLHRADFGSSSAALPHATGFLDEQALAQSQLAPSYPASLAGSPVRSRASSLQSIAPATLEMSAMPSPTSPSFASSGLTSPFRATDLYSSASSTIHPSQALRGSSPSDTSSVSGLNLSRLDTAASSATSSVFGGNDSTGPSTPYRSASVSRSNSQREPSQKHNRRRSSPIKITGRHQRKLSNAERKAICVFHLTHPGWKQDDIGAHFGYERSTISKTLKFKEKYLAMNSDDEEDPLDEGSQSGSHSQQSSAPTALYASSPSPFDFAEQDHVTPQPSPGFAPSSSVTSLVSLGSSVSSEYSIQQQAGKPTGRYPHIDSALVSWAREQAARGATLSDSSLQRQARAIARGTGDDKFKASTTWLDGFKVRAGITGGRFSDASSSSGSGTSQHGLNFSPPTGTLASSTHLPRALSPPVEEENEDDDAGQTTMRAEQQPEQSPPQQAATRRSKRNIGSKTVRCLASAKSTLGAFADGFIRSSSPSVPPAATQACELNASTSTIGGTFGDLSMDSESTPTHSTVHSRDTTRADGLAQPYSYSPNGHATGTSTPSRSGARAEVQQHQYLPPSGEYSPTDVSAQYLTAFDAYGAQGRAQQPQHEYAGLSSSSSSASFTGLDHPGFGMTALQGISPAASVRHHRRSGSTASTNSVYSGLTAFSSLNGPGTPLTGSLSGSYRDGQSNSCSLPGTPANAHSSYFASEQAQLQNSLLSTGRVVQTTPSSAYSSSSSSSSQHQHSTHQRYPQHSYPTPGDSQASLSQSQQLRRSTISGGLPFNAVATALRASTSSAASAAMTPSLSLSSSSLRSAGQQVTLEQAFSSLEIALEYLSTRAGQDYVSPKDLVVLADLKGKMERARGSSRAPSLEAVASAPATPSGLGSMPSNSMQLQQQLNSPFVPLPGSGNVASLDRVAKQQRVRLSRTQSAGSVMTMSSAAAPVSSAMSTRRSGGVRPSIDQEKR